MHLETGRYHFAVIFVYNIYSKIVSNSNCKSVAVSIMGNHKNTKKKHVHKVYYILCHVLMYSI